MADIIVTTGNDVAGHRITAYLGIVRGIVVRSPTIGQGFLGGLKRIVGGNIEAFADACEQARREAQAALVAERGKVWAANWGPFFYSSTRKTSYGGPTPPVRVRGPTPDQHNH